MKNEMKVRFHSLHNGDIREAVIDEASIAMLKERYLSKAKDLFGTFTEFVEAWCSYNL